MRIMHEVRKTKAINALVTGSGNSQSRDHENDAWGSKDKSYKRTLGNWKREFAKVEVMRMMRWIQSMRGISALVSPVNLVAGSRKSQSRDHEDDALGLKDENYKNALCMTGSGKLQK
jgi:hypothetical protein